VKVATYRACLEQDYFIKLIEQCERKRDDEIEQTEKCNAVAVQSEWDEI
jgi:hypothetical protein